MWYKDYRMLMYYNHNDQLWQCQPSVWEHLGEPLYWNECSYTQSCASMINPSVLWDILKSLEIYKMVKHIFPL